MCSGSQKKRIIYLINLGKNKMPHLWKMYAKGLVAIRCGKNTWRFLIKTILILINFFTCLIVQYVRIHMWIKKQWNIYKNTVLGFEYDVMQMTPWLHALFTSPPWSCTKHTPTFDVICQRFHGVLLLLVCPMSMVCSHILLF